LSHTSFFSILPKQSLNKPIKVRFPPPIKSTEDATGNALWMFSYSPHDKKNAYYLNALQKYAVRIFQTFLLNQTAKWVMVKGLIYSHEWVDGPNERKVALPPWLIWLFGFCLWKFYCHMVFANAKLFKVTWFPQLMVCTHASSLTLLQHMIFCECVCVELAKHHSNMPEIYCHGFTLTSLYPSKFQSCFISNSIEFNTQLIARDWYFMHEIKI